MHPAQIKAAIQMSGSTIAAIAEVLEVERSAVGHVIHGRTRSARIEEAIAKVVRRPMHEIWPTWYAPDGRKKTRQTNQLEQLRRARELIRAAG